MSNAPNEDYDDTDELVRYVLGYHASFMTDLETRITRTIAVDQQAQAYYMNPTFAAKVRDRFGFWSDERVAVALEVGPETCRRSIVHRILCDHGHEIAVNRCPDCRRIVRTPTAQQCFWCGHDWHASTNSPG